MAKLIRNAERAKTPVMAVVGAREAADRTLAIRTYAGGDAGVMDVSDVTKRVLDASRSRADFDASQIPVAPAPGGGLL